MPQANFGDFLKELKNLLTLIHTQTQKVFIPIAVSHSPVNPKKDVIVVLRTSDNVHCFSLDGWFTTDIAKLAPKFVIKTLQLKGMSGVQSKVKIN